MKRITRFFAITLGLGLVLGGLAAATNHQFKKEFVQTKAEGEPNATYSSIYTGWNNTSLDSTCNQVLIRYSGTAHGLGDTTINASEDNNIKAHIFLDGVSLGDLTNARIIPWNGQAWMRIVYPKTAVNEGEHYLEITEGLQVGASIFNSFSLRLINSLWCAPLDPLVETSDYSLFTPSDYNIVGNDTNPFYKDLGSLFADSFAFRFNFNIPASDLATTKVKMEFGATDIFGNGGIYRVYLNDSTYKFGMFFNNTFDWNTYKECSAWTADTTHLVEFYAIKTDANTMTLIFGVDGTLLWKTTGNISSLDFTGHTCLSFSNTGTTKLASYYSSVDTTYDSLRRFGIRQLHSKDIAFDDDSETDACLGENGYYAKAKEFYNTYLNTTQRKAFATSSNYVQLRERMIAWAAANGKTLTFDPSTGALVESSNRIVPFVDKRSNDALIAAVSIATISVAGFVVLFILKKKKATR